MAVGWRGEDRGWGREARRLFRGRRWRFSEGERRDREGCGGGKAFGSGRGSGGDEGRTDGLGLSCCGARAAVGGTSTDRQIMSVSDKRVRGEGGREWTLVVVLFVPGSCVGYTGIPKTRGGYGLPKDRAGALRVPSPGTAVRVPAMSLSTCVQDKHL